MPGRIFTSALPNVADGCAAVDSPPATPQGKRRRGGQVDGATAGVTSPSPGGSLTSGAGSPRAGRSTDKKKTPQCCPGCLRLAGISPCYINPCVTVTWAFSDNRGKFCKDCYTTWRSLHSGQLSLTQFAAWLGDHSNRMSFVLELVAFLSLFKDGASRITSSMIIERVTGFRFFAQMFGVPLEPSVVMPLADYMAKNKGVSAPLITIRSEAGGDQVGVFAPVGVLHPQAVFPLPQGGLRPLSLQTELSVTSAPDREALGVFFAQGVEVGDSAAGGLVPLTAPVATAAGPPVGRLHNKFDQVMSSMRAVLQHLGGPAWDAMLKVSSLKVLQGKLVSLHEEACADGNGIIAEQSHVVLSGLLHLKSFLQLHKEYVKGKHSHDKLCKLEEHVDGAWEFVNKQGITLSPTFSLLLFKVRFFRQQGENAPFGMTAALTDMLDHGCERVCSDLQSSAAASKQGVSALSWMRGVLFRAFYEQLSEMKVDAWKDDLPSLKKDVASVQALLRDLERPEAMSAVALDLLEILVLLDAAGASPRYCPSQVDAAAKSLNAPHMRLVQRAFGELEAGQAILEAACSVMSRSAQDAAANGKLRAAVAFLSDDQLPGLVAIPHGGSAPPVGSPIIAVDLINFELVRECKMAGAEGEGLTVVVCVPRVKGWVDIAGGGS